MRHITRNHCFTHRLDIIRQYPTTYEMYREGFDTMAYAPRSEKLDAAFEAENWEAFEAAEEWAIQTRDGQKYQGTVAI